MAPTTTGVQAVRTTGIYCRPECSARPHPENVTVFPLAAAAEAAGYRACHRCRPYREEVAVGAIGTELVCRAVRMITAGVLDDHDEDFLAAELGLSKRHLRRVFTDQLGVTPDALARSRRVHFARRLLDDTDVPIRDVAFAAGFGSVRQFQRACVSTFGDPPVVLRGRRRAGDRLAADGGLVLRLGYTGEVDWVARSRWFGVRAVEGVEVVGDGAERGHPYARTMLVDGDPAVVEIADTDGAGSALVMRAHLPHWQGLTHVVHRARALAALDVDQREASAQLTTDPLLAHTVARSPGLRPPGCWDPFEVVVQAVLGQQVTVAAATRFASRISESHGRRIPGLSEMGLTRLFPDPSELASADLSGIGLTGARRATVAEVSAAFAEGRVELPEVIDPLDPLDAGSPLGSALDALRSIRGIGRWTTEYVALRLGAADAFPAGDVALQEAYARLSGGPRPTESQLREVAQRWRPWRSFAAVHLWHSLLFDLRSHQES
ncbi:MAG: helix-turn-helix domain-containing protein [Microthrixaceae bacterium]|nr:helix-turn-helix domain-containing protein [Microthrixaceae bacterium]